MHLILCVSLVSVNEHIDPKCTEWTCVKKKVYVVLIRNTQQPDFFAAGGWTCDDKWGCLLTVDFSLTQGTGIHMLRSMKFSIYRSWVLKLAVQKPTLSTAVETSDSMAPTLLVRFVPHDAIYIYICLSRYSVNCSHILVDDWLRGISTQYDTLNSPWNWVDGAICREQLKLTMQRTAA
jgi:hypothetical protein